MMADYEFDREAWPDFDPETDYLTREDEAIAATMLKVTAFLVLAGLGVLGGVAWMIS